MAVDVVTTYTWRPAPGGTRMTLRNRGEPAATVACGRGVHEQPGGVRAMEECTP